MNQTLTIRSIPESIIEVEKFIEDLCLEYDIDDSVFGNMLISTTEAVNNAIIHGNKRDPEKSVVIEYNISETLPKLLSINIKDEGIGFDFLNLPDPTAPENIEMIGGRGVFLIKQLADFVIFSDSGNAVELQFKL